VKKSRAPAKRAEAAAMWGGSLSAASRKALVVHGTTPKRLRSKTIKAGRANGPTAFAFPRPPQQGAGEPAAVDPRLFPARAGGVTLAENASDSQGRPVTSRHEDIVAQSRLLQLEHLVARSGLDKDARTHDGEKFRRAKDSAGHGGSRASGAAPVRLAVTVGNIAGKSGDESFAVAPWTPERGAGGYDRSPSPVLR